MFLYFLFFSIIFIEIISNILGLNSIILYLCYGILINLKINLFPNFLFNISQNNIIHLIHEFGEIGIFVLMFNLGSHLNFNKLKTLINPVAKIVLPQLLGSFIFLTLIHTIILKESLFICAITALAMVLASTAIVSKILNDTDEFNTNYGQITFAILIIQDIITLFLISLYKSKSIMNNPNIFGMLISSVLIIKILVILSTVNMGSKYIVDFLNLCESSLNKNVTFLIMCGIVLLICLSFHYIFELPIEFAFLTSGLLLSDAKIFIQLENFINYIKGPFLGIFFIKSGLLVNFFPLENLYIALYYLIVTSIFKISYVFACSYFVLRKSYASIKMSVLINSFSEINFLLFNEYNFIYSNILCLSTLMSMLITPILFILACIRNKKSELGIALHAASSFISEFNKYILVIGASKIGLSMFDYFQDESFPAILIDNDLNKILYLRNRFNHRNVYFMNGKSIQNLKLLDINKIHTVVITLRDLNTTLSIISLLKHLNNNINIACICYDKTSYNKIISADSIALMIEMDVIGNNLSENIIKRFQLLQNL